MSRKRLNSNITMQPEDKEKAKKIIRHKSLRKLQIMRERKWMEIEQEDIFDLTSRPREEEEHNTEDMREVDMEQVRSEVRKGKQNF